MSVREECSGDYKINVITTTYSMVDCKCEKKETSEQKEPACPAYEEETVGECIKENGVGYKTVTKRQLLKSDKACTCNVTESSEKKICYCDEKKEDITKCKDNKVIVTETWKTEINEKENKCSRVKDSSNDKEVRCGADEVTKDCDNSTGVETRTVLTQKAVDCKCVTKKDIDTYRCKCSKEWTLVNEGNCSGQPSCKKTNKYIRKELKDKECIDIEETKDFTCCCPLAKNDKYCEKNKLVTKVTSWTLDNNSCKEDCDIKTEDVTCSSEIIKNETECVKGIKVIRSYQNELVDCKCVLKLIKEENCICKCPDDKLESKCNAKDAKKTSIVTKYTLKDCKCDENVKRDTENIECPPKSVIKGDCIKVPGKPYSERKITEKYFKINDQCECEEFKDESTKICECERQETCTDNCNEKSGVITSTTTYFVLKDNTCVKESTSSDNTVFCGSEDWSVVSDSGCKPAAEYGQQTYTYTRNVRKGCTCDKESKTEKCDCACTGDRKTVVCENNKWKTTLYDYNLVNCKCVKTETIDTEEVKCPAKEPEDIPCTPTGNGISKKCKKIFTSQVIDCKCSYNDRIECEVCKCPDASENKECNKRTNKIEITKTSYEMTSTECKKNTDSVSEEVPCDMTKDCKVKSACDKDTKTQTYTCTYGVLDNCICNPKSEDKVHPCECKPKERVVGQCDNTTCTEKITIKTFIVKVLKDGSTTCEEQTEESSQKCCCLEKPTESESCEKNQLIKKREWYEFNRSSRTCDKKTSVTDVTPPCEPPRNEVEKTCNNETCMQLVKVTVKNLVNCACQESTFDQNKACWCLKQDYVKKECLPNNKYKIDNSTYTFDGSKCVESKDTTYETVTCSDDTTDVSSCDDTTRKKTITTTNYVIKECKCVPTIESKNVTCKCPEPKREEYCRESNGDIVTVITTYEYKQNTFSCEEIKKETTQPANCQTEPKFEYTECKYTAGFGYYKQRTKKYEERVGCKCIEREENDYVLCKCEVDKPGKECRDNNLVSTLTYYEKVLSGDKKYDFSCVEKEKDVKIETVTCKERRVEVGDCIGNYRTYIERYEESENCICVPKTKEHKVLCNCNDKKEEKECINDSQYKLYTYSYNLLCNKKSIPDCECVEKKDSEVKNVLCENENIKDVTPCDINDKKQVIISYYRAEKCECVKKSYNTTIKCKDNCYDGAGEEVCTIMKKLNQCMESEFNYKTLCAETCGYCEKCPEDVIEKEKSDCQCRMVGGVKLCSRKLRITEFVTINNKCINNTNIYETLCGCANEYDNERCQNLFQQGKCDTDQTTRENCGFTCNPACSQCNDPVEYKECVQDGPNKGKYEVIRITFKRFGNVCTFRYTVTYEGSCEVCDKSITKKVSDCDESTGQRTITTHYVERLSNDTCVNRQKTETESCKECCPSVETKVGECDASSKSRVVTQIYWTDVNNCCRKQTVSNTYPCNSKCSNIAVSDSKCLFGRFMHVKIWYSGEDCASHGSHELKTCSVV